MLTRRRHFLRLTGGMWEGAHVDDVVIALEIRRQGLGVGLPVLRLCTWHRGQGRQHNNMVDGCMGAWSLWAYSREA